MKVGGGCNIGVGGVREGGWVVGACKKVGGGRCARREGGDTCSGRWVGGWWVCAREWVVVGVLMRWGGVLTVCVL